MSNTTYNYIAIIKFKNIILNLSELLYIKKEDKLIDGRYILSFCFKNGKENGIGYKTKKERDDDFEKIFNIFNNNGR